MIQGTLDASIRRFPGPFLDVPAGSWLSAALRFLDLTRLAGMDEFALPRPTHRIVPRSSAPLRVHEKCSQTCAQTQQTRDIDPKLNQWWATVADGGPTLIQHWMRIHVVFSEMLLTYVPLIVKTTPYLQEMKLVNIFPLYGL